MEKQNNNLQQQDPPQTVSKANFISVLDRGNQFTINKHLEIFRTPGQSEINYTLVMQIPQSERIPVLARTEQGYQRVVTVLSAALTSMLKNIQVKQPMTNAQVVDLAETIVFSSTEDNLAVEDVILFMGDLLRGKYGPIFGRFDGVLFFEKFEVYREERFQTLRRHRDEQHAHFKKLGQDAAPRQSGDDMDPATFMELYQTTLQNDD